MEKENHDVENPPIDNDEKLSDNEVLNNSFIEHEEIDDKYTKHLDEKLLEIRSTFQNVIVKNPNNIEIHESDSPLTLSYHNSDNEDDESCFKELSQQQVKRSIDNYYDDNNKYSNELDVLITYMKGQKNLYIQSHLLCKRKLHILMVPAMIISTFLTFLTPLFPSCDNNWSVIFIAILNGITAGLITLINYLKLETSTQTYFNSARQFDKLETSLEFIASKLMFVDEEKEKNNIVYQQIQDVESKINEMKEWNDLFLPDDIRGLFPIICHINIFSFIKRIETNKKGLIELLVGVKNEIRYILYHNNKKETVQQTDRIHKRLQYLIESKDKLKQEIIHHKNAYSYIDELFTIEIKNARSKSSFCLKRILTSFDDNSNPVVDKYIRGLIR